MNQRRILFLHPALTFSSATERLYHTARTLAAGGADVVVLSDSGSRVDAFRAAGIEVVLGEIPEETHTFGFAFARLRRSVQALAPTSLHATDARTAAHAAHLRRPYLFELDRDALAAVPYHRTNLRAVILPDSTLIQGAVNRAGLPRDRIHVVRHGPVPAAAAPLSGFEEGSAGLVRIGCAGALDGRQDVRAFLETLRRLLLHERPLHGFIFGEGPNEEALRGTIRELALGDRVTITSTASGTATELMKELDVFVSTLRDGEPGWLAHEACSVGLPCVFPAAGGFFALIEDGQNGLLYERGETGLTEAIERLLNHPEKARAIGASARRRMLQDQFFERFVDELQSTYDAALGAVATRR